MNPDAVRMTNLEGATTRAYATAERLVQFDIHDGHLAWLYDRKKGRVLFECEHVRKGKQVLLGKET